MIGSFLNKMECPTFDEIRATVSSISTLMRGPKKFMIRKEISDPVSQYIKGVIVHLSIVGGRCQWWLSCDQSYMERENPRDGETLGDVKTPIRTYDRPSYDSRPYLKDWSFNKKLIPYALKVAVRYPGWSSANAGVELIYMAVRKKYHEVAETWKETHRLSLFHMAGAVADMVPHIAYAGGSAPPSRYGGDFGSLLYRARLEIYLEGWRFVGTRVPDSLFHDTGFSESEVVVDRWFDLNGEIVDRAVLSSPPGRQDGLSESDIVERMEGGSLLNGNPDSCWSPPSPQLFSTAPIFLGRLKDPSAVVERLSRTISASWKGLSGKRLSDTEKPRILAPTLTGAYSESPSWENCGLRTILATAMHRYFSARSKWRLPWNPRNRWGDSPADYGDPALSSDYVVGGILSIWLFRVPPGDDRPLDGDTWEEFTPAVKAYEMLGGDKKEWKGRFLIGPGDKALSGYGDDSCSRPVSEYSERPDRSERWRWAVTSRKQSAVTLRVDRSIDDERLRSALGPKYSTPQYLMMGGKWHDENGAALPLPEVETLFMELKIGRNGRMVETNAKNLHDEIVRRIKAYEEGREFARERERVDSVIAERAKIREGFC